MDSKRSAKAVPNVATFLGHGPHLVAAFLGRVRTCPHNVARKPLWSNIAAFVGQGRAHRCDISRRSPRAVRTSLRHFSAMSAPSPHIVAAFFGHVRAQSAPRSGISRPCPNQVRTSLRHFSPMSEPSPHIVAAFLGHVRARTVRTSLRHFSPMSAQRCQETSVE